MNFQNIPDMYANFVKIVWTQEGIGFLTLVVMIIGGIFTYYTQQKDRIKELKKQNASKKVELWLRFQEQMTDLIRQIDEKYDFLVAQDENIKELSMKNINSLNKGQDDEIINASNSIVRLLARTYSLKMQYSKMYKPLDDDGELSILKDIDATWETDVMPYYYFYFDPTKRQLFISALEKGFSLENYSKQFTDFARTVIKENESINQQKNLTLKEGAA